MPTDPEFPSPASDEFVERAIAGDRDAFAILFRLTIPAVNRFLVSRCGDPALAEDLAQDAYIRAMRAIGTSFAGGSREFLAWVMRIARNRFLDHVKSGRVKWETAVDEVPVTLAVGDTESEALATIEAEDLREALSELTEEQQEVVLLRFLQGLHVAEVAEVTGRTEGAVKALQFRALRALARVLEERGISLEAGGG